MDMPCGVAIFIMWILLTKHFICEYMLKGYQQVWRFSPPIVHAIVHAWCTIIVLLMFPFTWIQLLVSACIDGVSHYIIDKLDQNNTMLHEFDMLCHASFYLLIINYLTV